MNIPPATPTVAPSRRSRPDDEEISLNTVIEVRQVSKIYGSGGIEVRAVDGVSLRIGRGEFTAIVGPSGSGKSTLLNLIGGLDLPSAGKILLAGADISRLSGGALSDFRRDHIGFIFQAYNLIPVLSAAENVEYIMLLQGVAAPERRRRVLAMLARVGLAELAERRPGELSGGQQQRVAVARAMVSKPDIILADEPTANLDSHAGAALLDMMKELNEVEGMTFVFSTHDAMIMERARRLIRIRDGRVESDETRPAA